MRIFHTSDSIGGQNATPARGERRRVAAGGTVQDGARRPEAVPVEASRAAATGPAEGHDRQPAEIPPDLAVCSECLAEIAQPGNRRFQYPFTNCAECGPRFTIATATPYDRPNTTMAAFRMCPACRREYESAGNRRFHAQPNACPECGPALMATTPNGHRLETDDVVATAAAALLHGDIVAIKGIGGFHLSCDATNGSAVARLRERKRRDAEPFAVMVTDLSAARDIAVLSAPEERLLLSKERPIVIARRREPSALAPGVAPSSPLIGLALPCAPLHHLLLARVARPLVMTSGNVADAPVAHTDEEALASLGRVAEILVLHNREIVTRCDDSVARIIAGRPVLLRRSRGYVPHPITLKRAVAKPVLACGGVLENTFCLARGDQACLGPHVGNLGDVENFNSYRESIDRLERFLHFEPAIVAHDLDPDYLSSRYAAVRRNVVSIGVQHHHAHIASLMAEHGVEGPVIGVAYDGEGLGTDGTAWGGEIMVAAYGGFQRIATFRPIALAGGRTAINQPWRVALALADDAFGGEAPVESSPLFRRLPPREIEAVRAMVRQRVNAPLAHGVGRYFDAMAALGLDRDVSAYDGQLALAWNLIADPDERGRYRYDIVRTAAPWELDLRAAVRDAFFELVGGEPPALVSARFHNTLVAATADLVRGVACVHGRLAVALSGGCFQNPRLTEGIVHELAPEFTVLLHARVPPNDGGLSLGQAVVADAVSRAM